MNQKEKDRCECHACVYDRVYHKNVIRKKYGMKLIPLPVAKDRPEKFSVRGDGCPCKRCEGFRKRNEKKRLCKNVSVEKQSLSDMLVVQYVGIN